MKRRNYSWRRRS